MLTIFFGIISKKISTLNPHSDITYYSYLNPILLCGLQSISRNSNLWEKNTDKKSAVNKLIWSNKMHTVVTKSIKSTLSDYCIKLLWNKRHSNETASLNNYSTLTVKPHYDTQ